MAEFFEKYNASERVETNTTIDDPVIFLAGYTKIEVTIGLIIAIVAVYLMGFSLWITAMVLPLAPLSLKILRFLRTDLPENFFVQLMWHFGFMNSNIAPHIRRPSKTYLSR